MKKFHFFLSCLFLANCGSPEDEDLETTQKVDVSSETTQEEASDSEAKETSSFLFENPCDSFEENKPTCNTDIKKVKFQCNDSYAVIKAKNGPMVQHGNLKIFGGYRQISSVNQDPILIAFKDEQKVWCQTNYETTGDDGFVIGLFTDQEDFYGVFSATGTQGTPEEDYRRFATSGWLTSYGQGGGGRISVLVKIDPETGEGQKASFVSARLSNGNSNSLTITNIKKEGSDLKVIANSRYSPRKPDRSAMTCSADPENHYLIFSKDLSEVKESFAKNCES
jgi:hypothetical protein